MSVALRIRALERALAEWAGPLVVFPGDDRDEDIALAERIGGRPVIRWPVARPRLDLV